MLQIWYLLLSKIGYDRAGNESPLKFKSSMLTLCHSHQILKYKHDGSGSVLRGLSVEGFAAERTGAVEGNGLERRPRERGKRSQVLAGTFSFPPPPPLLFVATKVQVS